MPLVSVEVILRHTLLVLMAISTTDTPLGSLNLRAPYGYLIGYFQLLYACLSVRQENWRGFGPNFWCFVTENFEKKNIYIYIFNLYPTAFPYGNGMFLHFYQQQESSTTKTVHKVINKRLKTYV